MGFLTALVLNNDFIHEAKDNEEFGNTILRASQCFNYNIPSLSHMKYGQILAVHHADQQSILAVGGRWFGGNLSNDSYEYQELTPSSLHVMKKYLESNGYRVTKRRS